MTDIPVLLPKNEPAENAIVDEAARRLYNCALPAVVEVQSKLSGGMAVGSGFFIDQERVVTNHHVINGHRNLFIMSGGKKYPGRVEKIDELNDVAIVRVQGISGTDHGVLQRRPSTNLTASQQVYLMGHPEGVSQTVLSVGRYTSRGALQDYVIDPQMGFWPELMQDRKDSDPAIRADAEAIATAERILSSTPIRGGNSGGPLLTGDGFVVGIAANSNEPLGRQALSVPIEKVDTLLTQDPRFSFEYSTRSRFQLNPVSTVLSTGVLGGLAYKFPQVAIPVLGGLSTLEAACDIRDYYQAPGPFERRFEAFELLGDALMAGGAVASFFPKTRPFGYAAFALGFAGTAATDFVPRYDTLTNVQRLDGTNRLPYRWRK